MPDSVDHYSTLNEGENPSPKKAPKIKLFIYYLFYSLVHMINMINIMTMNFWVILTILSAVGLSFYYFCSEKKCCHWLYLSNMNKYSIDIRLGCGRCPIVFLSLYWWILDTDHFGQENLKYTNMYITHILNYLNFRQILARLSFAGRIE